MSGCRLAGGRCSQPFSAKVLADSVVDGTSGCRRPSARPMRRSGRAASKAGPRSVHSARSTSRRSASLGHDSAPAADRHAAERNLHHAVVRPGHERTGVGLPARIPQDRAPRPRAPNPHRPKGAGNSGSAPTLGTWYYDYLQRRQQACAQAPKPIRRIGIDELSLKKNIGSWSP
jgi:hypothetical protein